MSAIGGRCCRFILEQPSRSEDGAGGANVTWLGVDALWGSLEDLSGGEALAHGAVEATRRVRIVLRARPRVELNHRLRLGTRVYDVVATRMNRRNGSLRICECIERRLS